MLYAHIPFCKTLCPYCSFNRFIFDEESARAYYRCLREEICRMADLGYTFNALYLGGGTPTVLVDELIQTIRLVNDLFGDTEVSCETNPDHLIPEVCGRLEGMVHRMSVGVQRFDYGLLQQMCRYQKYGSGEQILRRIQQYAARFKTLNVDMIFNFPSQTEAILREDIRKIIDSGASQVSFYPLMTAPSVERQMSKTFGQLNHVNEEHFYRIICENLTPEFTPSTAWTFSRQKAGMIDEYIADYGEYAAVGSGSFSYLGGSIYINTFSLSEYQQRIESGKMSMSLSQHFKKTDQMRYRFMMELFSLRFDRARFRHSFGLPAELGLAIEMLFMWLSGSFSRVTREAFYLTPRGRYLSVVMMREFFSGVNNVRDEARKALSADERLCAFPLKGKQLTLRG